MNPDAITSYGYEFEYEYDTSCGKDGLTANFWGKRIISDNMLWQVDNFALGIFGFGFKVIADVHTESKTCPSGKGSKTRIDITFTPMTRTGITLGIGPFAHSFDSNWEPLADFPAHTKTIIVDCCCKK